MLGNELKSLRKRLDYSATSFAEKLNVSRMALSNWERGLTPISEEKEKMIKQKLGFETDNDRADLRVHIDYLKLTFFDTTPERVMESVLGISPKFFITENRAKHNYEKWHSCGSIILMSREDNTQGVLLDLTSEGIIQFQEHLGEYSLTLQDWLRQVLDPRFYLGHELYSRIHSTRLDIAIDEMYNKEGTNFDLKKLREKKYQNLIYSPLSSYRDINTIKGFDDQGITLMFGARGNDRVFIRLYEKRCELANKLRLSVEDVLEEYGIFNRYELEIGKEVNPYVFQRYLSGECLADIAIDILMSKLEVYEEIETDTGIERQGFREWYQIFSHWKKVKISIPTDEISIERSMRWIEKQVAPTLLVLNNLYGEDWLFKWLRMCMDEVELPPHKEKQLQFEKMLIGNRQNNTFLYFDQKMKGVD